MRTTLVRLVPLALGGALLAGCAVGTPGSTGTTAATSAIPEASLAPPTTGPTPAPPSPAPSPTPTPTPTRTPNPTAPAVETFWDAVLRGIDVAGHLRITVIGPSPGVLRYEPHASATVVDDRVGFVCVEGAAFDGQSGSFVPVPGAWECGGAALVGGFRNTGQPVDAWSEALPTDDSVAETTTLEPDGRWRWDYTAHSAVFGGTVTTSVWVDPTSGQILDARRDDPTGSTRYGISYATAFPPITRP